MQDLLEIDSNNRTKEFSELINKNLFFTWHILGGPPTSSGSQPVNQQQVAESINIYLSYYNNNNQILTQNIKGNIDFYVVPDEQLKWINPEDSRLLLNLLVRIQSLKNCGNVPFINPTTNNIIYPQHFLSLPVFISNSLYNRFRFELDTLNIPLLNKIEILNNEQYYWTQKNHNNKNHDWISDTNDNQINWAWNYLLKNNKFINRFNNPITPLDYFYYIQASIDQLIYFPTAECILFLDKMKKTWSQKKFRDSGKAKKQFHLPLTKDTHKKIEFLERYLNKSKSQVIEYLVEVEFQKTQTDEHGNKKSFLIE